MPRSGVSRWDRTTNVILVGAAVWSAGLMAAAMVAPAYRSSSVSSSSLTVPGGAPQPQVAHTTSATMLQVNGARVLVLLPIPLLAVGAVAFLLHRRRALSRVGAGSAAWAVTAAFSGFCLLAMLTIGIFVLPVAVLLLIACARGPDIGIGRPAPS